MDMTFVDKNIIPSKYQFLSIFFKISNSLFNKKINIRPNNGEKAANKRPEKVGHSRNDAVWGGGVACSKCIFKSIFNFATLHVFKHVRHVNINAFR